MWAYNDRFSTLIFRLLMLPHLCVLRINIAMHDACTIRCMQKTQWKKKMTIEKIRLRADMIISNANRRINKNDYYYSRESKNWILRCTYSLHFYRAHTFFMGKHWWNLHKKFELCEKFNKRDTERIITNTRIGIIRIFSLINWWWVKPLLRPKKSCFPGQLHSIR